MIGIISIILLTFTFIFLGTLIVLTTVEIDEKKEGTK